MFCLKIGLDKSLQSGEIWFYNMASVLENELIMSLRIVENLGVCMMFAWLKKFERICQELLTDTCSCLVYFVIMCYFRLKNP